METVIGRDVISVIPGNSVRTPTVTYGLPTGVFVLRVRRTVWFLSQPCLLSDTDRDGIPRSHDRGRRDMLCGVSSRFVSRRWLCRILGPLDLPFPLGHGDSRVGG
jgi:hypothetical protein